MQCDTLQYTDPSTGLPVTKKKYKFETLDEAIAFAKLSNAEDHKIHKVAAYKCKMCHQYHLGRTGTEITEKYRTKLKAEIAEEHRIAQLKRNKPKHLNLNVVGHIDVSTYSKGLSSIYEIPRRQYKDK